jgi:hypothetical protein
MKLLFNLVNHQRTIQENNGIYFQNFEICNETKRSFSASGKAFLVINTGKSLEVDNIYLNGHTIPFEKPTDHVLKWRWNIPMKVTIDQEILHLFGQNDLKIQLTESPELTFI